MENLFNQSEVDHFLPEDMGHWVMPDYDVFLNYDDGGHSFVILCRPGWQYEKTLQAIQESGITGFGTAFKMSKGDNADFFYLENGNPVKGDGLRFVANFSTPADFLSDLVKPLSEKGFIPSAASEWFENE